MSNYPGEETSAPKRLVEAVGNQPLAYLIPKVGLSNLLDSSFAAITPTAELFATPSNESMIDSKGLSLNIAGENRARELEFRRPKNMSIITDSSCGDAGMLSGLSPLAMQCLVASKGHVSSDQIKNECPKTVRSEKHKLTDDLDSTLDLSPQVSSKKVNSRPGVTVNRKDLGIKYVQELMAVLRLITDNESSGNTNDAENWVETPDGAQVLTERCLSKLTIVFKNIFSIPSTWENIEVKGLINLLDILVENIRCATRKEFNDQADSMLNTIAHASTSLIFTILLIRSSEKRFSLEQYVWEPINFITKLFDAIESTDPSEDLFRNQLMSLQQSILLLPAYIEKAPFLDDNLISKFVYLFSNILMSNVLDGSNDLQLQNSKNNMKITSKQTIVILFKRYPEQREFIIEELLSHAEKMPTRRNQRKLRKLDFDIFLTDFTIAIVSMFEDFNCFDSCKLLTNDQDKILITASEKFHEMSNLLETLGNRIVDTIFDRFCENSSSYRHVLENYIYDLIALLPYPQWAVSEKLLGLASKKLLLVLSSSHQQPASIETTCLQLLSAIGASIFEIKCETRVNEKNNLIELVNYPESFPQFLNSYDHCLKFCLSISERRSAAKYLWHQNFGALLKTGDYTKDDPAQNDKIKILLKNELDKVSDISSSNERVSKETDYPAIKSDYYSFLHVSELINLYEPYLKLVLSLLESEKIKIKSTAIKCLSTLALRDRTILSSPMVKETISKALENSSASVKDAILDLVSIGSSSEEYYRQINANFDDESVLIRKHILKINEKIYNETSSEKIKVFVASRILLRMEDEEDVIIDMARQSLLKQWIFSISEQHSTERQLTVCKDVIAVMAGVASLNQKCSQHFEWFLNFFLVNDDIHSPEDHAVITRCLNILTDTLVQFITEMQALELQDEEQLVTKHNLLNLLAKFGDCNVSFITKEHIIALYPYLVSDETSDLQYSILHVFKNTLEKVTNFNIKFLYDLETTLLSRLPRMNVKEISEAMPLIWCVASLQGDTGRVTKACTSCFHHLSPYIKQATKESYILPEGKLQRLIYLATGFACHCNFTNANGKPSLVGENETVYAYVAKRLLVLSRNGIPHIIRRISIKNLTQLCGSHPKLFNSKPILNLLDEEFEADRLDIKLVILESLYDFFTAEERKSILRAGVNASISSNERLKKKLLKEKSIESANDGVCSALVARFLKQILKISRSADIKSSLVAVRLLKLILQYGYANPSHCIPTVIALTASNNDYMNFVAVEMLRELFEKYETLVFSSISQGIKLAIDYTQNVQDVGFYRNVSFLGTLQSVIGKGKKNSTRYFKSISRILQMYLSHVSGGHADSQIRDAIIFMSSNLSAVNFSSQHDLVSLLKNIELESEQSREALIDAYEEVENGEINDSIKNAVIILLCLKELKRYLLISYGLKIDLITTDSTQAFEMKKRQFATASEQSFVTVLNGIITDSKHQGNFNNFMTKLKQVD